MMMMNIHVAPIQNYSRCERKNTAAISNIKNKTNKIKRKKELVSTYKWLRNVFFTCKSKKKTE